MMKRFELFFLPMVLVLASCQHDQPAAWYDAVDTTPPPSNGSIFGGGEESLDYMGKYSSDDLRPPILPEAAFEYLAKTDEFGTDAVGYAGTPSFGSVCANALMQRDDAREVFLALLERGQLPGQLYALCGLYVADRAAYEQAVVPYRTDDRSVLLFSGCIKSGIAVTELVEWIDAGDMPNSFARLVASEGLVIEPPQRVHRIRAGETMAGIAHQYYGDNKYWRYILDANPGVDPTKLMIGDELVIPEIEPAD